MAHVKLNTEVPKLLDTDHVISDRCSPSSCSDRQTSLLDTEASESGWTIYLDQPEEVSLHQSSEDFSPSVSRTASLMTKSLRERTVQSRQFVGRKSLENFDDSSVMSDASSGPEQPFLYEEPEEYSRDSYNVEKKALDGELTSEHWRFDYLGDDSCASKVSCVEIDSYSHSTTGTCRANKRRKRDLWTNYFRPAYLIRSREESTTQVGDLNTDPSVVEGCDDNLEIEHMASKSEPHPCHDLISDSNVKALIVLAENSEGLIDDCLHMLRLLIPNSEKLDREEVLSVAIEYVKSLELRIQIFETAKMEMADHCCMEGVEILSHESQALAVD